jgi:hypothetical protein
MYKELLEWPLFTHDVAVQTRLFCVFQVGRFFSVVVLVGGQRTAKRGGNRKKAWGRGRTLARKPKAASYGSKEQL